MAVFSMPLPLQRAEEASPLTSSYNDHNPTRRAPEGPYFTHHHVGIRVLTNEFGENTNSVHSKQYSTVCRTLVQGWGERKHPKSLASLTH